MPWPFRRQLSVDFLNVPHEPSGFERVAAAAQARHYDAATVVALIDSVLDGQQTLEPDDRNVELIDVLLDVRNLLRVPVTPGRSS